MLKFGIKSVLLGSAVYYTVEKGVWRDSATTSAIYEEIQKEVSPYIGELKSKIPYELPPLSTPTNDRISYLFKYYWNFGVKSTFKFLVNLPDHASNAMSKTYGLITSTLEAVEPSPTKDDVAK